MGSLTIAGILVIILGFAIAATIVVVAFNKLTSPGDTFEAAFYISKLCAFVSVNGNAFIGDADEISMVDETELLVNGQTWSYYRLQNCSQASIKKARHKLCDAVVGKHILDDEALRFAVDSLVALKFIIFLQEVSQLKGVPGEDGLTPEAFEQFLQANPVFFRKM
jgi:hypothetical protein